ncbi:hypothetical protein SDC9_196339 [bioreactor metagenome]|uniref:Uncharacterized protein n=1 Tax=bioreactor metagenome TaxID=1076179 RepID=A0A645IBX0_9ZZZZ
MIHFFLSGVSLEKKLAEPLVVDQGGVEFRCPLVTLCMDGGAAADALHPHQFKF